MLNHYVCLKYDGCGYVIAVVAIYNIVVVHFHNTVYSENVNNDKSSQFSRIFSSQ